MHVFASFVHTSVSSYKYLLTIFTLIYTFSVKPKVTVFVRVCKRVREERWSVTPLTHLKYCMHGDTHKSLAQTHLSLAQMKVKGSFVSEYMCLCVLPRWVPSVLCMCSVTFSRSAKEKEIGSTWVMIWNTANWLSDRPTRCLSLRLSFCLSLSFSLSLFPVCSLVHVLFSMTFKRLLICVKKPVGNYLFGSQWRDVLL